MNPLPELLTLKEAAALLRINQQTIRRLLLNGQLKVKYLRFGGKYSSWRVSRDDLERFMRES